jgi:predicted membrane protein
MSRKLGSIFVLFGILLLFAPWLVPLLEDLLYYLLHNLPLYIALLITFITQNEKILERIFPLSLILIGFAILVKGFLSKVLLLLAFAVALLSIVAIILPSGLITTVSMYSISQEKIEFFIGDVIVKWDGGEEEEWLGNGRLVKVEGGHLDIEFFAGSVKVLLPNKDVSIDIRGGIGEVRIFAPENVRVEVQGSLGIGSLEKEHVAINPDHTAKISYKLGIGEIKIE